MSPEVAQTFEVPITWPSQKCFFRLLRVQASRRYPLQTRNSPKMSIRSIPVRQLMAASSAALVVGV